MAGAGRIIGRIIVLLLLIAALAGGGVFWFDYLNIIDAKVTLAPVYDVLRKVPFMSRFLPPGESRSQGALGDDEDLSLDAERLNIRLEALAMQSGELDLREEDITRREGEIEQMAQELEDRQKALDDQEKSFNDKLRDAEDKTRNVEQVARRLTNMPPANAVAIISAMEDQDAIDVLRMTEDISQREGSASLVPLWLSLMDAARVATLQRKMTGRPSSLN